MERAQNVELTSVGTSVVINRVLQKKKEDRTECPICGHLKPCSRHKRLLQITVHCANVLLFLIHEIGNLISKIRTLVNLSVIRMYDVRYVLKKVRATSETAKVEARNFFFVILSMVLRFRFYVSFLAGRTRANRFPVQRTRSYKTNIRKLLIETSSSISRLHFLPFLTAFRRVLLQCLNLETKV